MKKRKVSRTQMEQDSLLVGNLAEGHEVVLYVGDLPDDVNEADLEEYFSNYGTCSDIPAIAVGRGETKYGIIKIFKCDETAAVLQDTHMIGGCEVYVKLDRKALPKT
eukprot:gnl/TRDRNA2_/TRDRNA2_156104_c0_seq2.p1 gnl/TRDRNA2_/TRDRNA2_156104_c0~~gnl/TRDRNA2_/TRDRNA2_156104_c0_seq2.p1  ORF type:complete len:107 (-),score=20.12 gnl/TRDRNA2_/TRDRNA2_156104_c0_seq2:64-384(-)